MTAFSNIATLGLTLALLVGVPTVGDPASTQPSRVGVSAVDEFTYAKAIDEFTGHAKAGDQVAPSGEAEPSAHRLLSGRTEATSEALNTYRNPDADLPQMNVQEVYCMALAVYFEGGSTSEDENGQRLIASVIHARARADQRRWGGSDICDVVFYQRKGVCQFSFACLPAERRTPTGGRRWELSLHIAREEIEGASELYEHWARYYMNPALTSDRNACRFRRELVPLFVAGRHEFFREPLAGERSELARKQFAECTRYTRLLVQREQAAQALQAKLKQRANKRLTEERVARSKSIHAGSRAKTGRGRQLASFSRR